MDIFPHLLFYVRKKKQKYDLHTYNYYEESGDKHIMRLFNFFKKKEIKEEPVYHFFYGVIVTNTSLVVKPQDIISLYSLRDKIYANMNFIFFDMSIVHEYIRGRLLKTGGYAPLHIYHVSVQPLSSKDESTLENICDKNKRLIDINTLSDLDVRILEDFTKNNSINGICPGIETVDELNKCLSLGYDKVLDTDIRKKYIERFSKLTDQNILSTALFHFKLEIVIDIFDRYYMKYDGWETSFKKDIEDLMLSTIKR